MLIMQGDDMPGWHIYIPDGVCNLLLSILHYDYKFPGGQIADAGKYCVRWFIGMSLQLYSVFLFGEFRQSFSHIGYLPYNCLGQVRGLALLFRSRNDRRLPPDIRKIPL